MEFKRAMYRSVFHKWLNMIKQECVCGGGGGHSVAVTLDTSKTDATAV